MNANELMKKIEYYADCNARYHMAKFYNQNPEPVIDDFNKAEKELKSMLRQQQAEIEVLKSRELTDEEIINCAEMDFVREELTIKTPEYMWIMDFAKAILIKAQEK